MDIKFPMVPRIAILKDLKNNGTAGGGSAASTTQQRNLNTVLDYGNLGVTIVSNRFKLPPGQYFIEAYVPAFATNKNQAWLYNNTLASTVLVGSSELAYSSGAGSTSRILGRITVTVATHEYEIIHYTETAQGTNGLGVASGSGSAAEVFSEVKITKL
jgi:hypothetical protein